MGWELENVGIDACPPPPLRGILPSPLAIEKEIFQYHSVVNTTFSPSFSEWGQEVEVRIVVFCAIA